PIAIIKLDRKIIEQTKARTMWELVNKTPGVFMRQLSDAEGSSMSIRQPMSTTNYFLYLEDGIPIRPQGFHNHNGLSLYSNVLGVENIEIAKGPVSSIYGPEAVGGAVNVITRKAGEQPQYMIGYQGDEYGMHRGQFNISTKVAPNLGIFFGGFYGGQKNGGWRPRTDYTRYAFNFRLDYDFSEKTSLTATMMKTNYDGESNTGAGITKEKFYARDWNFITNDYGGRIDGGTRSRITLNHKWNTDHETYFTVLHRWDDRYLTGHSVTATSVKDIFYSSNTLTQYNSYGAIGQHTAKFNWLKSKFLIGGAYDFTPAKTKAYKTNILYTNGVYKLTSEEPNNFSTNTETDVQSLGIYAQYDFEPFENLRLQVGLRQDIFTIDYENFLETNDKLKVGKKEYKQLTPKIGATYKINNVNGFYANYSQGFTPPPVSYIFAKRTWFDPAIPGQPNFLYDLDAARFHNAEVGGWLGLFDNKLKLDFSLYQLLGKNEVVSVIQPDGNAQNESAGETSHRGIELGITYRPTKELLIRSSSAFAEHKYEKFLVNEKTGENYNGKYMASAPGIMSNNEIVYTPNWLKGFMISAEWQYLSPYYFDPQNTFKYEDKGFLGLKGQSLLNLRAMYEIKGFEVFASLINATNELFVVSFNTSRKEYSPGYPRTFGFGAQYTFKPKQYR
ncbi:MAG: TonB-dependent receptor, partial [Cloacibacterium sp.]|nr:TonB-dependent receptor [Cloacibacterium sp.]